MRFPVTTLNKDKILVVDNLLSNKEADVLAKAVFNKPDSNTPSEFYFWNQLYAMNQGNTLGYNHAARHLMEQVQFRCMQAIKNELEDLPTLKLEYSGIALSTKAYAYHADNSFPEKEELRDLGTPGAEKNDFTFIDRKEENWIGGNYPLRYYSTILFLNSDFKGGEEVFPQHKIEIAPRQGRLIAFPSTKEYVHGARKTSNGTRYTLSSWYHKVFNYYDQLKNDKTKNMNNIRDVFIAIEDNNLLSNV